MKIQKTNKLFYNKYPYRIECRVKGSEYINKCGQTSLPINKFYFDHLTKKEKESLKLFAPVVKPLFEGNYKIRQGCGNFGVYAKDKDEMENIKQILGTWISSITEPDSDDELNVLSAANHKILCHRYPHRKFKYKVLLRSNLNVMEREKLSNWINLNTDKCRLCKRTKFWIDRERKWCFEPFMYVESSKELMMINLLLSDGVKKTYEYIQRSTEINSVSEDELCKT